MIEKIYNVYLNNLNVLRENTWKLHWNMSGPLFIQTHLWLDDVYDTMAEYVDKVAEHTKGLGGNPLSEISKEEYFISPIKSRDYDAQETFEILLKQFTEMNKKTIELNNESEKVNDLSGVNILSTFAEHLSKYLYFVKQTLK